MTKRIFRSICVVALFVAVSCVILVTWGIYSYFTRQQQNQLSTLCSMAAASAEISGDENFAIIEESGCRITWVNAEGDVLYDSVFAPEELENHLQRQEIAEAFEKGEGESTRYSDSLTEHLFYYAIKLSDGTVIRLSYSQSTVLMLILEAAIPLVVIFLVTMLVSLYLAFRLSKQIVKPLNELDLDDPLSNKDYGEINPLLVRISSQQRQLKRQEEELEKKQAEFEAITGGMGEGLVLISGKAVILSVNPAAKKLLSLNSNACGKDFMVQVEDENIQSLVRTALFGKKGERVLNLSGGIYEVKADPVFSDGMVTGAVLLMLDVTEKQQAENMRREFTANVSHELKTPLHAISGYAELMSSGMVKNEDMEDFSGKIYREAGRLITLVEDIIRLSRLDEGIGNMEFTDTDLLSIAEEAAARLMPNAERAGVSLKVYGERAVIKAIPTLVSEIVYNLTDNAVKYNRENGSVEVVVADGGEYALISVADTGIGIPKEHQNRVFERFYRVDKSHSKNVGGTGLGLSIVKHACIIHGAELKLESNEGKGTRVTVKFRKNIPEN